MPTQKKKPRQRNRPRNKANREHQNSQAINKELEEQELSNEDLNLSHTSIIESENSVKVPHTSAEQNVTTEIPENDSQALRIIQRLMREKIIGKNKTFPQTNTGDSPKSTKKPEKERSRTVKTFKDDCPDKTRTQSNSNSNNNAFLDNLQKKVENLKTSDSTNIQSIMLENLQKLFDQKPVSDVETSDDEEEYVEYIYKPRQYFSVSLCNLCKNDLLGQIVIPCARCFMTYYCSMEHMKADQQHRQLCYALRQVAENYGDHIFYKCHEFSTEQFRSYRIVTIRRIESVMNRDLTATEKEVILFPRICNDIKCREYRFNKLEDCNQCGQVAYCKDKPEHLSKQHNAWCKPYQLFKNLIVFQEKFGRLDPSLPSKVLRDIPAANNTRQILNKLNFDMKDSCEYAALSQIATGPLTAWYALKMCGKLKTTSDNVTIHLIGAEIEFEVDVLHKWELFFLHLVPHIKELNVVFVGPELNPRNISFEQLQKTKCCRLCRKSERTVKYYFENRIYHEYCDSKGFLKPNLICFYNAGLYRSTGFHLEDTWPETILAAATIKCPVVVTSYTEYEAPLDMTRFVQECNRRLNVVLPPTKNPFASEKPERNFISDEDAPLMFKNYYCFVIE